jgi:uncharacterized protein YaiI (UPF0178 family)
LIEKKRKLASIPTNIPLEKLRLKEALVIATQEGDTNECEKINERITMLTDIESSRTSDEQTKMDKFAAVNERNRQSNHLESREAERAMNRAKKLKGRYWNQEAG